MLVEQLICIQNCHAVRVAQILFQNLEECSQYRAKHICRAERYIMIFEYEELKECVEEDFERFYKMGFNEKQIFPAVLNEYEHGEDFGLVENICIHVLMVLNYAVRNLNYDEIIEKLNQLMNEEVENEVKVELGNEYTKFITDLNTVRNNK